MRIIFCVLTLSLFSFNSRINTVDSNRELLLMEPEQFFAHKMAKLPIDPQQPSHHLLSVSVFQATNYIRKKYGLTPFAPDYSLHIAGVQHIKAMRSHGFFSHINPHNSQHRTFQQRIAQNGGQFTMTAENIALVHPYETQTKQYKVQFVGSKTLFVDMKNRPLSPMTYGEFGKSLLTDWFQSKGHRSNILEPALTHLGVAIFMAEQRENATQLPKVYAVQNFGAH